MFKKSVAGFALVALAVLSTAAQAMPITGTIAFGGTINPTGGATLGTATGVDIIGDQAGVAFGSASGDLVDVDAIVTYNDFTFAPFTPVEPLWAGSLFSFTLEDAVVESQSDAGIILSGRGTMRAAGFDDTSYMWSFSADSTGIFAFSTTNAPLVTTVVPEPATLGLLGLAALALVRRRRKA